jgi:hypothetical protein
MSSNTQTYFRKLLFNAGEKMVITFNKKIFFYTTSQEGSAEGAYFQDLIINLAEGFQYLGVQYYSSNNYWKLSPEDDQCLLQCDPHVTHQDCDVVVLERQWVEENGSLPKDLFNPCRQYITVYLDCADGLKTFSWLPEFRQFDFIFKTHYNRNIRCPSNLHPWAFGLSSRVIQELSLDIPFAQKKRCLLVNFRHRKFSHSLRRFVGKTFILQVQDFLQIDTSNDDLTIPPHNPYHLLRWTQTGRRHNPNYYKRLTESVACACFGGYFLAPDFTDYNDRTSYFSMKLISRLGLKTNRISQWDSWRFWESLAAGCVTFHVDFEKYGFELPVLPKNWEHYIGIDLDNIQESIDKIAEQPEVLEKISIQGREWVLQNYSPKAVALRFMEKIFKTEITV